MNVALAWLFEESPSSRIQARLGRLARVGSALTHDPIAVAGFLIVGLMISVAALVPLLPIQDGNLQVLGDRLLPPSHAHWFGTDMLGRDMLARVVAGTRPSLTIVAFVLALVTPLGTVIGIVAGFYPQLDGPIMRLCDIFMAFPRLILAIAIAVTLGAGVASAIAAIALTGWPRYARIARAETLTFRSAEFVQAAKVLGASDRRILLAHILPLCVPAAIVRITLDASSIILITSGLGFLGASVAPPQPEWGAMIAEGRDVIFEAWWVSTIPGIAILLFSLGFNLLGDALRNVVDPRS